MPALFRGPTRGYRFTDKDIEWLGRSMWGEAKDEAGRIAVAWAHIQRFLLYNYKWLFKKWHFYQYVQGHSQPINPIWRRDGWKCRPPGGGKAAGPYHGKPDCAEYRLKRRDKYQTQPVPAKIMRLARAFANGELDNPFSVKVYDFMASTHASARARQYGINISDNIFYTRESFGPEKQKPILDGEVKVGLEAWLPTPETKIVAATAAGAGTGFVIALLGGIVAWFIYRKRAK